MGTIVEKNTLRAMILEILLKDQELLKDILQVIAKENPHFLELTPALALVSEPQPFYNVVEKGKQISENEGINEQELQYWIGKHFAEYDTVFKALA